MISKQYIKDLEFNTIEEFFNYVVDSKINGNYTQTKNFIQKMSKSQKLQFNRYLNLLEFTENFKGIKQELKQIIEEVL